MDLVSSEVHQDNLFLDSLSQDIFNEIIKEKEQEKEEQEKDESEKMFLSQRNWGIKLNPNKFLC